MAAKNIGDFGENAVCDALIKRGYRILDRNFRSRFGEIDIIAQDRDCIAFIEVKTRKSAKFANACESVTFWKQQKIIKTARYYLGENVDNEIRFDVAEVYYRQNGDKNEVLKINYFKNAFIL